MGFHLLVYWPSSCCRLHLYSGLIFRCPPPDECISELVIDQPPRSPGTQRIFRNPVASSWTVDVPGFSAWPCVSASIRDLPRTPPPLSSCGSNRARDLRNAVFLLEKSCFSGPSGLKEVSPFRHFVAMCCKREGAFLGDASETRFSIFLG